MIYTVYNLNILQTHKQIYEYHCHLWRRHNTREKQTPTFWICGVWQLLPAPIFKDNIWLPFLHTQVTIVQFLFIFSANNQSHSNCNKLLPAYSTDATYPQHRFFSAALNHPPFSFLRSSEALFDFCLLICSLFHLPFLLQGGNKINVFKAHLFLF